MNPLYSAPEPPAAVSPEAIWMAITTVRRHQLERLKGENASMRCALALLEYEREKNGEKKPQGKTGRGFLASEVWRRLPRRKRSEAHCAR
jgi:hypothetical protein